MKKTTLIKLAWIHAALCTLLGIIAFMAILIHSAGEGIITDQRPFLLPLGLIVFAAITFAWLRLYKQDRAVRTRSVVGFFTILSVISTAFLLLFLFRGLTRGGLVIEGAESRLYEPSAPAIVFEVKGDTENGGMVKQALKVDTGVDKG